MSDPSKAVFLSYASQDAEAARRIRDALRAAGVEVWFDQNELVGGDAWDAKIRRQIAECALFVPVISANTQARLEGYFRIEWKLAAQRAMSIASGVPFILPVVIDETREPVALVPDRFRAVQWMRLARGVVTPQAQQRLQKLWSHRTGALRNEAAREETSEALPATSDRRARGDQSNGRHQSASSSVRRLACASVAARSLRHARHGCRFRCHHHAPHGSAARPARRPRGQPLPRGTPDRSMSQ